MDHIRKNKEERNKTWTEVTHETEGGKTSTETSSLTHSLQDREERRGLKNKQLTQG